MGIRYLLVLIAALHSLIYCARLLLMNPIPKVLLPGRFFAFTLPLEPFIIFPFSPNEITLR